MVSIIKMRPWYMPMMSPMSDDVLDTESNLMGINVYEKDGRVHVEAPIPGVPAESVDITYTDGRLHIAAKHSESEEEKDKKKVVYKMERESSFEYMTDLPANIDAKTIEATARDGVLYVTAQVAESSKPRKISVKSQT